MLVQLTRIVMSLLGALGGLAVKNAIDWSSQIGLSQSTVIILFVILGCLIGFIVGGIIGRELTRALHLFEEYLRRMSAQDFVLSVVGMLLGLVVALIVTTPIRGLQPVWIAVSGTAAVFVVLGYFGVRLSLIKRGDFRSLFPGDRRLASDVRPAPPKLLDTSAVIDGRFAELARAGFLEGELRVPGFVLAELQTLADSADDTKRARGRRGIDLLAALRDGPVVVAALDIDYPQIPEVDGKLAKAALDMDAALVTVDHNLSQVARVQGATVLNINELAQSLRPNHLPGERLRIAVIREGKESDQGVGYLEDGTMVVVQNGRSSIGAELDLVVTSVLQTSAGRMVFARPAGG